MFLCVCHGFDSLITPPYPCPDPESVTPTDSVTPTESVTPTQASNYSITGVAAGVAACAVLPLFFLVGPGGLVVLLLWGLLAVLAPIGMARLHRLFPNAIGDVERISFTFRSMPGMARIPSIPAIPNMERTRAELGRRDC